MKLIPLTQGFSAKVDDEDFEFLSRWRWTAKWQPNRRQWVVIRNTRRNGKRVKISMSRTIMEPPAGFIVDHKNGDQFDNRRSNLRWATNQQNQHNQRRLRRDNTSGYKGVTWSKLREKWNAQIYFNKKRISLGHFETRELAAVAYDEAARKLFGEFAAPNFEVADA